MSEVFLGINKAGQLYVDATLDASITHNFLFYLPILIKKSFNVIDLLYEIISSTIQISLFFKLLIEGI